jgi:hypothetical protein
MTWNYLKTAILIGGAMGATRAIAILVNPINSHGLREYPIQGLMIFVIALVIGLTADLVSALRVWRRNQRNL